MSLPAPDLDTRQFQQLMDEALERIPRYTPEWTNFNASDPGMALVQLYAWMSETILYELNRVPELNYIKFLDLLGITPRAAQPARAEVSFLLEALSKPGEALVVPVPMGTTLSVDDPDLEQALTFETDRSLTAINADIGLAVSASSTAALSRKLVTRYDEGTTWLHAFDPFGAAPAKNDSLYLGLLLRPVLDSDLSQYSEDALPAGPLDLYFDGVEVYDKLTPETTLDGPVAWQCAGAANADTIPQIDWQIFTGNSGDPLPLDTDDTGWRSLSTSRDDTRGLTRSGHVVLELPPGATPYDPANLQRAFWADAGLVTPPKTQDDLVTALKGEIGNPANITEEHWIKMGVPGDDDTVLNALLACANSGSEIADKLDASEGATDPGPIITGLDPTLLTLDEWLEIEPAYALDLATAPKVLSDGTEVNVYRPVYWIRAKLKAALDETAPRPLMMKAIRLNTTPATQATTVREERLGVATGRPAQTVSLRRVPVLIDPDTNAPDLTLTVTGSDNLPVVWDRVDDFYRSLPDSRHYTLDPTTGEITFGDGRQGQMPVAGSRILAASYRVGGGQIGNVGAGTITKIKGRLRGVKEATNHRPAHDGTDAETVERAKARAPHDLRSRDRAVSAEDFRDLALLTPGVNLHKVFALARRKVDANNILREQDGAVTLVVLPKNDDPAPQPSQAQHRAICRWLEPRRLITTELHVIGPRYVDVTTMAANITVKDDHDLSTVTGAIQEALLTFLHPIKGGVDGSGWPFGEAIYHGDLYDRMLAVPGVRRVTNLRVALNGAPPSTVNDFNALPEGYLPVLTSDAINLVASYA